MGLVCYQVRHGYLYHFDKDNTIGASLAYYGEWAEAEIYLLSKILQKGDQVLDIGANVGTHTLAFARLVTPQGRVMAFDAQQNIFQVLSANMIINQMYNVQCLNVMMGSEIGVRHIPASSIADATNFGAMSFVEYKNSNSQALSPIKTNRLLPITMITVDSLSLERCALIKVDVEGMELDVFQGAIQTIQRCRPTIYFEQTGEKNLAEILSFFRDCEYGLFWHVSNPFNAANFNKNSNNIFGGTCETNIIALPKERIEQATKLGVEADRLMEPVFSPPIPSLAVQGWNLPQDAYKDLEQPKKPFMITDNNSVPSEQLEKLQLEYNDLREDRIKAQEIMENQAREITRLNSLVNS
ncbi:FkbM family methyltransferase [Dapis sp. BLCC M126]|uniref:FkbM family methyltransferase n=1 Tax=Dapis sp. BLCC M126 TaxID=3400189 RepID=UPI003CF9F869